MTFMDTREAARRWARTWAEAWPAKDTEALVDLQTETGDHYASMFRRYQGKDGLRAYVTEAFDDETSAARVWFAEPKIDGEVALCEYWAQCEFDGKPATISGCTVVHFDDEGKVLEARDYSHTADGHIQPPDHLFPPEISS